MNKGILRYVGIAAFFVLAFVLFTNRDTSSHPYRSEIRSLKEETQMTTDLFVTGYRTLETVGAYDIAGMELQTEIFEGLIQRYQNLDKLPEASDEDYAKLLEILGDQALRFEDILTTAKLGEPIPGEYALALKETVERRILYEGRMARY